MKRSFKIAFAMFASLMLAALLGSTATAQHLISGKAGFVNRTDGKVFILRHDSEDGEKGRASLGTQMRDGDKLSTEVASFAEVLLNPGSYLRLNEKTEVHVLSTNLSLARFELVKGSVIVEVGEVDKKAPIEIITQHGTLFIKKEGLQRIDSSGEMTSVAVRQGEIFLGTREEVLANKGFKIGRGKVARLTGTSSPFLAKLDRDAMDNFDIWSFNRAQTLVAANYMALRQSRRAGSLAYGWIYDPFYSCYTFIPRRGFCYSPYGFGYFNAYSNCWSCSYYPYGGYGGYVRPGGGGTGNLPARVITGNDHTVIRRGADEGRRVDTGSFSDASRGGFGDSGSRGISSPPPSSAPSAPTVISAPAPSRGDSGSSGGGRSMPSRP